MYIITEIFIDNTLPMMGISRRTFGEVHSFAFLPSGGHSTGAKKNH